MTGNNLPSCRAKTLEMRVHEPLGELVFTRATSEMSEGGITASRFCSPRGKG